MDRVSLTLALIVDADPIEGTVHRPDGSAQDFCGWVALIAAVQELIAANGGTGGDVSEVPTGPISDALTLRAGEDLR